MMSGGERQVATRESQKARTRRDLVAAALELLTAGRTPTVTEVADAADVSRRTAYRYFPSGEQLLTEALLEGTRSDVEREIDAGSPDEDVASRVDRFVNALHDLTLKNEPLLRQMVRFTIDRDEIEPGVPSRPSRRLDYVEQALGALRDRLSSSDYERLVHAMAVVVGIEARIVLRDICGLGDAQILETERWAAHALLAAARGNGPTTQTPT
jgi:AcrR family transcriptional regulator